METEAERAERLNAERAEELERVPFQRINKSRWPKTVRPISTGESDGIGIDRDGRLYWDGRPVEIIGRRLDLTNFQIFLAVVVALFTVVGGIGAAAQGWAAYHDWACRNKQRAFLACPAPETGAPPPKAD
ncbi:hypothetical protein [Bradyrhizobium sp. AUGA SZCCT0283]|uniref:hypothetical protein n=1 Tax=Bradyrhizobium sp. AUGA SZCCT0283 TaxID=2807671 RepID=UPI001BA9AA0E|nr:hypothetical protein [Bradyrhizobium sp. AUGA SZCCT0283]MBR1277461.1 hypothetical protein [Bradyrhizobium sp. AUGA SZCCT0283]